MPVMAGGMTSVIVSMPRRKPKPKPSQSISSAIAMPSTSSKISAMAK